MLRIALVTCSDFPNLTLDDQSLKRELDQLGFQAEPARWDDSTIPWNAFAAIIIRSPWDYYRRAQEFRAWIEHMQADRLPVFNPPALLLWNLSKLYLRELSAKVPVVPSFFVSPDNERELDDAIRALSGAPVIVKPSISAGSDLTFRLADAAEARDAVTRISEQRVGPVILQPFLREILDPGEWSLIYFDGRFSHAILKTPRAGDFRSQEEYQGRITPVQVSATMQRQAEAVLAALPQRPLYARVDGIERDGRFLLMELEALEPSLYFEQCPGAARRLAQAIAERVSGPGAHQPS